MTKNDFKILSEIAPFINSQFQKIALLSPTDEKKLFPNAVCFNVNDWNLNYHRKDQFDCIIVCNIFQYLDNVELAINNLQKTSKYVLIIDLIKRKRSAESEFGQDGDQNRFYFSKRINDVEQAINLPDLLKDSLLHYTQYNGGDNEYHNNNIHFCALIKGEVNQPLIRMDD